MIIAGGAFQKNVGNETMISCHWYKTRHRPGIPTVTATRIAAENAKEFVLWTGDNFLMFRKWLAVLSTTAGL